LVVHEVKVVRLPQRGGDMVDQPQHLIIRQLPCSPSRAARQRFARSTS
jgi:hypothetical protein